MVKYVTRKCPQCTEPLGVLIVPHAEKSVDLVVDGYCSRCGYELHWLALAGGAGRANAKIVNGPWLRLAASNRVAHKRPSSFQRF
jgi:ribosomal protein S27AE